MITVWVHPTTKFVAPGTLAVITRGIGVSPAARHAIRWNHLRGDALRDRVRHFPMFEDLCPPYVYGAPEQRRTGH
jgi:hypothetical protein